MGVMFQISLKSVRVIENGEIEKNAEGVNVLSASLFYPRQNVPSVTSVRELALKDDETIDFTQSGFRNQLLFKETICGESVLEVEISAIEEPSKFEKLFNRCFEAASTAAIKAVGGMVPQINSAIKRASASLFDLVDPKDSIHVIGRGEMPISQNTASGEFTVHLTVPRRIELKQTKTNAAGQQMQYTKTLDPGFVNAQVVFNIKKFD